MRVFLGLVSDFTFFIRKKVYYRWVLVLVFAFLVGFACTWIILFYDSSNFVYGNRNNAQNKSIEPFNLLNNSLVLGAKDNSSDKERNLKNFGNQANDGNVSNIDEGDNQTGQNKEEKKTLIEENVYIQNEDIFNSSFAGWIPTWAYESGLTSFDSNISKLNTLCPVFYKLNSNGEVEEVDSFKISEFRNRINQIIQEDISQKNKKIEILPTLQSFDSSNVSSLVTNSRNIDLFIGKLVDSLEKNSFDGVDLNLESIELKDKDNFYIFLEKLSETFQSKKLKLVITVLPKWGGEDTIYSIKPETRTVLDYSKLAAYVDEIRIMAYDYQNFVKGGIGGIAPIEWVEEVTKYASQKIPKEKISLGLNLYGYSWIESGGGVIALTESDIVYIRSNYRIVEEGLNQEVKEGFLKYVDSSGLTRVAYFPTEISIKSRIEMARNYGIKNFVFWRLGDDVLYKLN